MSVLLGEERRKLLTSLEIGNVNEKGSPRGESWCSASLAQSCCATEAAVQALGSKTSWNGLPSISQTRQATPGALPEGGKCFLMYNTKHVKEELQFLLVLQGTESNNLGNVFDLMDRLLRYGVDTHSGINRMSWLSLWGCRANPAHSLWTCFYFWGPCEQAPSSYRYSEKLNNLVKVTAYC